MDPLRAGAVSIVGGTIVHYCSARCREIHLARDADFGDVPEKNEPAPEPMTDVAAAAAGRETDDVAAEAEKGAPAPVVVRSRLFVPFGFAAPHVVDLVLLAAAGAAVMLVSTRAVGGYLPAIVAAAAVLVHAAVAVVRERRSLSSRALEIAASTFAAGAMVAACAVGHRGRAGAVMALALLAAERVGRLVELAGRARSGVLEVIEGRGPAILASEWRDNSAVAARIRKVTTVVEWARIPLAGIVGIGMWLFAYPLDAALLAAATLVVAISPRTWRMATGDAHLSVALRAARAGVVIRDAHTVHMLASARVALFMARRALLAPEVKVSDWLVADGVDGGTVKDALAALEAKAEGRFADALREFLGERSGAGAAVDTRMHPGRGLEGECGRGYVICGTRALLLERGISTAALEPFAHAAQRGGRRVLFVALDGATVAAAAFQEEPLSGVREVTRRLALMGLDPAMMTTAEVDAANALGGRLGIEHVLFERREEEIDTVLADFAQAGERVVLVGDGKAFEEGLRGAAAAISMGLGRSSSLAGVDVRGRGLSAVVDVIEDARRASRGVGFNLAASAVACGVGLGIASGWHSPYAAAVVGALVVAACAVSTFNGPFRRLERLASVAGRAGAFLRRLVAGRRP